MEKDFFGLDLATRSKFRKGPKKTQIEYLKRTALEKYHEVLIPKVELGCKRKVMDTDYFACLHRKNMELVYSDPIEETTEKEVHTDAIILANGFQTQQVLYPLEVKVQGGITLNEHVSLGPFLFPKPCPVSPHLDEYESWYDLTTIQTVEPILLRRRTSILRNLRLSIPQLLHHDGSQYHNRPLMRNIFY